MARLILIFLIVTVNTFSEDLEIAKIFDDKGVTGTMVITSIDGKTEYVHNDKRSRVRFLPASTFKIPNTLIALEEGIMKSDTDLIKWDGIQRDFLPCNKDQTLKSAFQTSCVWFYQAIAQEVGIEKYKEYINKIEYGNKEIGINVTTFWLEGNFGISAKEQIWFLNNLVMEKLPFSKNSFEVLKRIMIIEENSGIVIRAKTGWATSVSPAYGWFVGYVESKQTVWLFATNMDVSNQQELALRKEITLAALRVKKIVK
jgi:beta-lactamase class D